MNSNAEEFWTQGDFGYVKKEVDTLKTLCKPQIKVCESGPQITVSGTNIHDSWTLCYFKPTQYFDYTPLFIECRATLEARVELVNFAVNYVASSLVHNNYDAGAYVVSVAHQAWFTI